MKKDKQNDENLDCYDYLANAASVTELTGLIPANPFPEFMESYEDVFHFEPPKKKKKPTRTFSLLISYSKAETKNFI